MTRVPFNPRMGARGDQAMIRLLGGRGFAFGARDVRDEQMTAEVREARKNRKVNGRLARTAAAGAGGGFSDIQFATGRPRDPLFYWRQNNLPYDFSENEELAKVRSFCRLLYQTDPIIGSCVDIFSKFPVLGFELECKDSKLGEFYEEQFFDEEHLDYEEFLVDIGREYWTVGECWPFATFNEDLGIWDDEELLNPDDIKVERSPFLKDPRYFIRLPWTIRQVLQTRQPAWEYNKLIQEYPELAAYTSENSYMPVSSVLLQQLRFKGDTFNVRGVPLLTRAMRPMLQQEMLNTALDSIADRLYTPLILCKLGASATDLGTSVPWIPTDDDLESFELALDAALAGDFRALIHNFAIEIEQVFGKENMPDLTPDFERIEDRVLQVFGLSRTFLMGAQGGQTYAADALNKELVTQLMTRYQKYLHRHFRKRALIVAEAQEHYDYEERAGKRYVVMEEVLETDEETGEKKIVEQPKLLIPELRFKTLNFKDEDLVRQFREALRESGVPISMRTRTRDLDFDLDEEIQRSQDEAVQLAVAEQETRKQTFIALRDGGYPIPDDLMADFAPMAQVEGVPPMVAAEMIMTPRLGVDPAVTPNLAPTDEDMMMEEEMGPGGEEAPPDEGGGEDFQDEEEGGAPPGDEPQRPEESDDQRGGMPRPGGGKTKVHASAQRWYHGTNAVFSPGDSVSAYPESASPERGSGEHAFYTGNKYNADYYAASRARLHGGEPHVYEVRPGTRSEEDPDDTAGWAKSRRTRQPLTVVREVPHDPGWKEHIMTGSMRRVVGSDGSAHWVVPEAPSVPQRPREAAGMKGLTSAGSWYDEAADVALRDGEGAGRGGQISRPARRTPPTDAQLFRRTGRVRGAARSLAREHLSLEEAEAFDAWEMHKTSERERPWVSGPAPSCYQAPAHVGIRSRLPVPDDIMDGELYG